MAAIPGSLTAAPPRILTVSIIIPVYNEHLHVESVVDRVLNAPFSAGLVKEIIVVDDGSTDGTAEILEKLNNPSVKVYHSASNFGKGTAIRVGLKYATGEIVVIQDGDTEYNPVDIDRVITPIIQGEARVSYGSRFLGQIDGMY